MLAPASVRRAMTTPSIVATPARREPARTGIAVAAMAIVVAALAAYANSLGGPFVFDDARSITGNPGIQGLWPLWRALWPSAADLTVSGRPLANFTLALNYAVSGTHVWSYHALNLLIHLGAGLTLFGIVRRTLLRLGGKEFAPRDAVGLALAAAVLWTVHPLQTEAVTYVIQRVESLMGLFYLLTLYGFIRGVEATAGPQITRPRDPGSMRPVVGAKVPRSASSPTERPLARSFLVVRGSILRWSLGPSVWYVLSVLSCLLGMAAKEVMVTAPLMVLLYDRAFVAGSLKEAWRRRRWVHLSLAGGWLPLLGFLASTGWNRGASAGFDVGVAPWAYWLTQFEAVARYLGLAAWPHPLVFDYGKFWVHRVGDVLPYAAVVLPLAAVTGWAVFRRPRWGFVGAWFFVILAPTSVVPGTMQMVVEHRMYLPLAAVVAAAVLGLDAVLGRRRRVVFGVLAVGFGVLTFLRNQGYHSEQAIWSDTVAKRPDNTRARNGLALALDHAGRTAEAVRQFEAAVSLAPADPELRDNFGVTLEHAGRIAEAVEQYRAALRLKPDFAEARSNLGNALMRSGQVGEAIRQYRAALRLRPDFAEAHYNLGLALDQAGRAADAIREFESALRLRPAYAAAQNNLGNTLQRMGRTADAMEHYRAALLVEPDFARAHYNLGVIREEAGQTPDAIAEYETALRIDPDLTDAGNNLGVLLCRSGQIAKGLAVLRAQARRQPDSAGTHFNLGVALEQAGRPTEAANEYGETLRLDPGMAAAHNNLGSLYGRSGRLPEATAELRTALRLRPDYAEAHNNLGNAFLQAGQWDEAAREYETVRRLRPGDAAALGNLERLRAARAGGAAP